MYGIFKMNTTKFLFPKVFLFFYIGLKVRPKTNHPECLLAKIYAISRKNKQMENNTEFPFLLFFCIFFYVLCTLVLNIFPFSGSHFNPATLTLALVVCWIFLFYTMQRFLFLSILSSTAHTLRDRSSLFIGITIHCYMNVRRRKEQSCLSYLL